MRGKQTESTMSNIHDPLLSYGISCGHIRPIELRLIVSIETRSYKYYNKRRMIVSPAGVVTFALVLRIFLLFWADKYYINIYVTYVYVLALY